MSSVYDKAAFILKECTGYVQSVELITTTHRARPLHVPELLRLFQNNKFVRELHISSDDNRTDLLYKEFPAEINAITEQNRKNIADDVVKGGRRRCSRRIRRRVRRR